MSAEIRQPADIEMKTSTAGQDTPFLNPYNNGLRGQDISKSNQRGLVKKLFLAICFLVSGIFLGVIVCYLAVKNTDSSPEICLTKDCVNTASRLMMSMNLTADPCEDYFEYACGGWNQKNAIDDDVPDFNTFTKLRDELQFKLRRLLEADNNPEDPKSVQDAKRLYTSCLNITRIEQRGKTPLIDLLRNIGGWPILDGDTWDESKFNTIELIAKLRLYNNRILINQWLSADDKNSSANIIQIDQQTLGMTSRQYYLDTSPHNKRPLEAYLTWAIDTVILLGADKQAAKKEMSEMLEFETQLANISDSVSARSSDTISYHKYTIEELSSNVTSKIDWKLYFKLIFESVDITLSDEEFVVLYGPKYMEMLGELLEVTPKRTISNYVIWRFVMNRIGNMPNEFLALRTRYYEVLRGTKVERARWRECINYVNNQYGYSIGRMFVKENFDEKSKKNAEMIIDDIMLAFEELLNDVKWMDEATRKVAIEKAHSMNEKIGYPDFIMDNEALDKEYAELTMNSSNYFENVLVILENNAKSVMILHGKTINRTKWSATPAVVNAFYSAAKNQIMFPAGILQKPFYHGTYPKSLNFGGIAMVIGHEITHGFDDKGRQFDADGNLKQWWTSSAISAFNRQKKCIIEQYSNYTVKEVNMNVNGINTQGENIADNGGLKQAYKGYRSWVKRNGREETPLPAIGLNHNQLFFLNFAQVWCGTARPENYIQSLKNGRHSPGRFRVIGTLSNSYDFASVYSCPRGSPMNPVKKCTVW